MSALRGWNNIKPMRLRPTRPNPDFGCPPRQIGRACRYQRDPEFGGPHFADLQRHTETTATQIAGTQAQSLDENERIAARLIGLEQKLAPLGDQQQNLAALGDQLSSIKQTIEGATLREQENIAALSDQQQSLTALTDQLSSIKKTIDEANVREQDIKNSIDGISSRILDAQTRLDELL